MSKANIHKTTKQQWLECRLVEDGATDWPKVAERAEKLLEQLDAMSDCYDYLEWAGAKQGTPAKPVKKNISWDSFPRTPDLYSDMKDHIQDLEAENTRLRYEVAMLKAQRNATMGRAK